MQFSSFTVTPTGSLTIPSGLTIRVSGNVNISGPVTVSPMPVLPGSAMGDSCYFFPSPGATTPALSVIQARSILRPPSAGYGSGGVGTTGGSVAILNAGSLVIASAGSISAPGPNGIPYYANNYSGDLGASAGGIIILASRTSINNAGVISATGGLGPNGGPLYVVENFPAGGGGGGGIVHLLAPFVIAGNTNVSGGPGGANGIVAYGQPVGPPGGACGGSGGAAGVTGSPGGAGQIFTTIVADPATLLLP